MKIDFIKFLKKFLECYQVREVSDLSNDVGATSL